LIYLVNSGDHRYQTLCNKVKGGKDRVLKEYCDAGRPLLAVGHRRGTVVVQILE